MDLLPVRDFRAHSSVARCVMFTPANPWTLGLRHVTTPSVWVLSRRHQLIGHIGWVWSVAWSSDGASLVSGSGDCTTRKWDAQTGDCRFVRDTPNKVYAVSLTSDCRRIVSYGENALCVWDASTGDNIFTRLTGHQGNVLALAYFLNGQYFVSGPGDETTVIWDLDTGEKVFKMQPSHPDSTRSIAFHPSGKVFVTGSEE